MAYNSLIPQPTDAKNKSQQDLLNNFAAIKTLIDVNHVDFASGDQGKHNFVTLPLTSSSPAAPTFLATEEGFYNLVSPAAAGAKNEIYVHKQTLASTAEIPMTASVLSTTAASNDMVGWSYLPSGVLLKWGKAPITNSLISNTINIDSISGGPAYSKIFSVQLTAYDSLNYISTSANLSLIVSGTDVRIWLNTGSATTGAYYFAIGV